MTNLAAARGCLRAALALPTLVGFVWPRARLAGAALGADYLMNGHSEEVKLGLADLRLGQRERG
jgi:hypothetical protein